jgi:hypothetical protein
MRKSMLVAGMFLLAASCSNESVNEVVNGQAVEAVAPVKVHVADFSVSLEDESRGGTRAATDVADYNGINAITLAFYSGSVEVYKSEQLKPDDSFGDFSLDLPMGSYTMVVIAYKSHESSPFELTSPTAAAYTGDHSFETFATTQAVNITNTDAVNLNATLNRIVSKLEVHSTDGKAGNVKNVRMTFSAGGKSFNPTTGLATVNTGFSNTVSVSAAVGTTSISNTNFFLATDEQTMNVTIETLDNDGNALFTKTVENVPFKRNRITKLTGSLYTAGLTTAFLIEPTWVSEHNVAF